MWFISILLSYATYIYDDHITCCISDISCRNPNYCSTVSKWQPWSLQKWTFFYNHFIASIMGQIFIHISHDNYEASKHTSCKYFLDQAYYVELCANGCLAPDQDMKCFITVIFATVLSRDDHKSPVHCGAWKALDNIEIVQWDSSLYVLNQQCVYYIVEEYLR